VAVRAGGKFILVYELHLASWTSKLINLLKVEVWEDSHALGSLEGAKLNGYGGVLGHSTLAPICGG
jgi:hypothetical protein